MKKIYILFLFALAPFIMKAQCGVQVQHTNELCSGDCNATAMAFPSGQSPYTYLWQPSAQTTQSISGLCAGSYTVIVIDANNCTATSSFTVTAPPPIMVALAPLQATCGNCCDGAIVSTVSGGTAPYTYAWSNGQTSSVDQALCPGTYTLCVTDANGCQTCQSGTVTFSTGIQDVTANDNLTLFPNPAMNFVGVKETFSNSVTAEINVYDVLGNVLLKRNVSGVELNENFDVSSFSKGVYFISVKSENGTSIEKFVKE